MTHDPLDALITQERLPASYREIIAQFWEPLATHIARAALRRKPLIVGVNGGQGTGKSTMCMFLEVLLKQRGVRAVTLGLDDLYLPRAEREKLAEAVHPLFVTRGVPGTHTALEGIAIIEDALAGRDFIMPRFDKGLDDRKPAGETVSGPVDVLFLEGWCVGAKPQDSAALARPVNMLEAEEDAQGIWRGLANRFLAEDYARLFGLIDLLVMLKVEDFAAVLANRKHQEAKLRASRPDAPVLMSDADIDRFCAHYERLTKHILAEMPARADLVFPIGPGHQPLALPRELSA